MSFDRDETLVELSIREIRCIHRSYFWIGFLMGIISTFAVGFFASLILGYYTP